LTKKDYELPANKDPSRVKELYTVKKNAGYRGCTYSLVGMDDDLNPHIQSVHKSDYKFQPGVIDQDKIWKNNQMDFKLSHLKLDSEPEHKFNATSMTHEVFTNPQLQKDSVPLKGAGMTGQGERVSRADDMFEVTINNTVTRYPHDNETFLTTVSQTYKGEPTEKRFSIRPTGTHVDDYIHPYSIVVQSEKGHHFKYLREMSTVSRRTYVAPEVMKEVAIANSN
jgi:hypothetical protein